ncbi:MAG TPA: DUF1345 domain-containing protein [Alphaproteobacteria bacterium]|nr:DUF1345 domain-containing protein [Alphaproteobacteria bacterium]
MAPPRNDPRARPRPRLLAYARHLRQRPRLILATAVAIALYIALPATIMLATRLLVAFDVGALVFLAANWLMMVQATPAALRRRARAEDAGRAIVLALAAAVAVAILLAIGFQLHGLKDLPSGHMALHVGLAAATILLSWVFMNTMFALHYAHAYYDDAADGADLGGLEFPGRGDPDYWDFLYFSFVIGMTFQVSDVQVASRRLRRIVLAHGVLGFFFNVVVLALTINIVAGMV